MILLAFGLVFAGVLLIYAGITGASIVAQARRVLSGGPA